MTFITDTTGIFVWYHRNFIFLEFLFTFSKIYGPNLNYVLPQKNANYLYHSLNSKILNVSYSAARKKAACYAKRVNVVYPSNELG